MPSYKYLIIGGGMTADAAIGGIRQVDQNGAIGVISAEPHKPYNRPPSQRAAAGKAVNAPNAGES